ncbi:MAG TPA: hypothetical protein VGG33_10340, partial [Polyangia bacterium]
WILLWMLERETFTRLLVKGVPSESLAAAAEVYRRALQQAGCRILGERKKVFDGQVNFVFSTPVTFDRERFEQVAATAIPAPLRGALDWDLS